MTLHRPAHALSIARLLGKPSCDDSLAPDVTEPMDETLLASEIARIMKRRADPAAPARATEPKRWLGDEADRDFVEHYVETPNPSAETDREVAASAATASDAIIDEASPAAPSASVTAGWMREARQQRRRSRLRDAGGWTISIVISALIIITTSLAMVGWSRFEATWRQIVAPHFDVSETSPVRSPSLAASAHPSAA